MNINVSLNHILPAWESKEIGTIVRHHIICKDSFDVSVQASKHHYCNPRKNQKYHKSFELMCDISNDKDLLEYYHDGMSICSCVPVVVVEKLILRHGGIDWNKTPNTWKGELI